MFSLSVIRTDVSVPAVPVVVMPIGPIRLVVFASVIDLPVGLLTMSSAAALTDQPLSPAPSQLDRRAPSVMLAFSVMVASVALR